ncbi:hypothetical protein ACT3SZ_02530 [Corynebacterium sp. AOP40-9SA-29]|uniref:hypothetical protein n=1 Tax=Corynebacterium sp. AOP40-9SA-29 TaxID=3457677 RepID=UPI004034AF57
MSERSRQRDSLLFPWALLALSVLLLMSGLSFMFPVPALLGAWAVWRARKTPDDRRPVVLAVLSFAVAALMFFVLMVLTPMDYVDTEEFPSTGWVEQE